MFFYLTTLNLVRFLIEEPNKVPEGASNIQIITVVDVWNHLEFLYKNYILNCLIDSLYNVHSIKRITKKLWESMDGKYKPEDVGAKKFIVNRFLNYKTVNFKTEISQVQKL